MKKIALFIILMAKPTCAMQKQQALALIEEQDARIGRGLIWSASTSLGFGIREIILKSSMCGQYNEYSCFSSYLPLLPAASITAYCIYKEFFARRNSVENKRTVMFQPAAGESTSSDFIT